MIGLEIMQLVAILAMNSNKYIHIKVTKNDLHIQCEMVLPQLDSPNITNVDNLYIHGCRPPASSSLFPTNTMEIPNLKKLVLDAVPSNPPLTDLHFMNLTVNELRVTGIQRLEPSINFLSPLTTMTKLTVSNMVLPPLPATSQLTALSLNNGRSRRIGGCSALRLMYLAEWTVSDVSGSWLGNCKNMTAIWLQRVSVLTIYRVVQGASTLDMLTIRECALVSLSANLFARAPQFRALSILDSGMRSIHESAFDHQRSSLQFLDLTNNELSGKRAARALLGLSKLKDLYLAKNRLSDFCEYFNKSDRALQPQYLHLEAAGVSRLCFASWSSLQVLGLDMNNITDFMLTELPMPRAMTAILLTVHLKQNPLRAPPDTWAIANAVLKNFLSLESNSIITVLTDLTLDCDCQYGWFAKALRGLPYLRISGLLCNNKKTLLDQPRAQLECDKFGCGPCTCRRSWREYETIADCYNRSLRRVPRIPDTHSLLVGSNRIEVIYADDFPTSLQVVDLSDNKLQRVDVATAHALLAESSRRVRLAGNPLACDCENGPLINSLHNYITNVEDYNQLKCANSEIALAQVSVFEMCGATRRVWVLAVVAAGCILTALAAIATALYFRYSRVVRVFLHARGLLCCLDDDETDADFLYDAFISFSHQDIDFVDGELLPRLENESNGWRICVHYRDWAAGELIPTQIARSVAQSRRTIVILSRNFLESRWAMLEFRTAYATALHDGRARLVLIVLDDVVDDQIDSEVRGYVRTNTYLKWNDPWFWDKLLYVMPPRRAVS